MARTTSLVTTMLLLCAPAAPTADELTIGNIGSIEPLGMLIKGCSLPGETRADKVVPRHANAIQVSRSRWLIVYSTHGYRGVDDERSIVYQLRKDTPDGPLVREGFLARTDNDWRPADVPGPPAGKSWVKQHGHMVAFGVPKGALIDGKVSPNANRFVACWRVLGRPLDKAKDYLERPTGVLAQKSQGVEWIQFRLNEREDDIEIVEPIRRLRQKGFETGDQFCAAKDAGWINQSFCPPAPSRPDKSGWAMCNHFAGGKLAIVEFEYDRNSDRYYWTGLSPWIDAPKTPLSEASLLQIPEGVWWVSARAPGKIGWTRAEKLLGGFSTFAFSPEPKVSAPHTTFRCADGVIRIFTGDSAASPYRYDRDPLYLWDVRPSWPPTPTERRTIYDTRAAKLPIRPAVAPKADFPELFPHQGTSQLVVWGVSTRAYNFVYEGYNIPPVNDQEVAASGVYAARITYRTEPPALWEFAKKE